MQRLSNAGRQQLQAIFSRLPPSEKGRASRTALYLRILAEKLPEVPELWRTCEVPAALLGEFAMDCGFYHDIGKAGAEGQDEQAHVWAAPKILQRVCESARPGDGPYLEGLAEAAVFHHERWDGKGYPWALAGDDIPLWARLCRAAETYERLASGRNFGSHKKVTDELARLSGTELDPRTVTILAGAETEIQELRKVIRR